MEESTNEVIAKFKKRIERENKNSPSSRRTFSKKLKKDIAEYSLISQSSYKNIVQHLKLSNASIQKWRSKIKPKDGLSEFKKIEVVNKPQKRSNSRTENYNVVKVVMLNQIVLILLLTLLLLERSLAHLIS